MPFLRENSGAVLPERSQPIVLIQTYGASEWKHKVTGPLMTMMFMYAPAYSFIRSSRLSSLSSLSLMMITFRSQDAAHFLDSGSFESRSGLRDFRMVKV